MTAVVSHCLPALTTTSNRPSECPVRVELTNLPAVATNGRKRRVSPVAVRPGEGRFSRPITANQAQRRELVFMPLTDH